MRQLFLSFEGRIRTKDTRRPPHASPWWSRIISCRVADPWIGFWVSAYPEIRLLPSLLLHRILLSIIPCLCSYTYLESRRFFDTFILSFPSIVKLFGTLSKKRKKRKNFDFRSPRFRKGIFSIFPSLSRIHVFPLVLVTFSYFSFLRPSLLAWRPLEPRRVAADS